MLRAAGFLQRIHREQVHPQAQQGTELVGLIKQFPARCSQEFPPALNCSGSLQCPERPLGTSIWAPPVVPSVPLALPALTAPRSRKCCEGRAGFVFSTGALRQQNEGKNRRKQNQNPAFSFVPLITRKYELIRN